MAGAGSGWCGRRSYSLQVPFDIRGTERENFTIGVGTPFFRFKCPFCVI